MRLDFTTESPEEAALPAFFFAVFSFIVLFMSVAFGYNKRWFDTNTVPSGAANATKHADTALRLFGKPELKGHRRLGVLLARRNSVEEAKAQVMAMREKVKVTL